MLKRALGGCGTGHVHAAVQELLRFRHVVVLGRIAQLRGEGDHDFSTMRERRCGREESSHAGMVVHGQPGSKHTGGRLSWIFWSWLTSASSLVPASKFIDTREVAWSAICGAVKTQKGEGWG